MHLPNCVAQLKALIHQHYPQIQAKEGGEEAGHCLWLLNQVEQMNHDYGRACLFIGYVICYLKMEGLLSRKDARVMAERDMGPLFAVKQEHHLRPTALHNLS